MCKTLGQEEFGIRRTEKRPEIKGMQDSRRLEWDGARPGRVMGWRGLRDWGRESHAVF